LGLAKIKEQEDGPSLPLGRVNGSLLINLLWVSKIDTVLNTIRFITPDNSVIEIPYEYTAGTLFDEEIKDHLKSIQDIPYVFL